MITHDQFVACDLLGERVGYIAACLSCPYHGPRPFTCGYPFLRATLPPVDT